MGGGLGDICNWLFMHDTYANLGNIPPDEKVVVALTCGNPFARELFSWHPKASQFEVHNFGFMMPADYEPIKRQYNFPENTPSKYFPQQNLTFYPSPADRDILKHLENFPYVVINPAAGHPWRNIPEWIYRDAIDAVVNHGLKRHNLRAVLVGRNYHTNNQPEHNHVEPRLEPKPNLIDLIDKVTVPATLEVIRRSAGVFCCHSAVCLASWYLKKPVFLMYPKDWGNTQIKIHPTPYNFGKDFDTTRHADFESYDRLQFERFLDMAAENHGRTRS